MKETMFCLNNCRKSPLNLFFDKVYCTNLNRRTDRWKRMEKIFHNLSLDVQRTSGFDFWNLMESLGVVQQRTRYAVTETHRNIIKDALENDYDSILILEDDTLFCKGFNEGVGKFLEAVPDNWDMFYLGYYAGPKFPWNQFKDLKIMRIPKNKTKHEGLWAAHAYGLRRNIYEDILNCGNDSFTRVQLGPDDSKYGAIDVTYYYKFQGYKNCYATNPPLILQTLEDTDIDAGGKHTKRLNIPANDKFRHLFY